MINSYKRKRDFMVSNLNDMGIDLGYNPDSAFYAFADMSKFSDDSLTLSMDILDKVGLGVAPGIDFGPSFKKYIRLSYSSSLKNIQVGLDKIQGFIDEQSKDFKLIDTSLYTNKEGLEEAIKYRRNPDSAKTAIFEFCNKIKSEI